MTSLQLGLFAVGGILVGAVIVYNWIRERGARRRIEEAFRNPAGHSATAQQASVSGARARVEPTLPSSGGDRAVPENALASGGAPDDDGYERPLDVHARIAQDLDVGGYDAAAPVP